MLFYYILRDPHKTNFTKVGITRDPASRIRSYQTASPQCGYQAVYALPHRRHEKKILELLKDIAHVDREVVHLPPQLVQNIVEGYFQDNDISTSPPF